jgi:hypothetical protein
VAYPVRANSTIRARCANPADTVDARDQTISFPVTLTQSQRRSSHKALSQHLPPKHISDTPLARWARTGGSVRASSTYREHRTGHDRANQRADAGRDGWPWTDRVG